MRRGHPGIGGGWRNDNSRHFRPRSGGTPHYRPPRNFGPMDQPRFSGSGPRAPFGVGPEKDRNAYRRPATHTNSQRPPFTTQRQILPLFHRMRQPNQFEKPPNQFHVNTMGDIDQRQNNFPPNREFHHRPPPWENPQFEDPHNKSYRNYDNEQDKTPVSDYAGHRPPASDHYRSNPGSTTDSSNSFNRSVDDTVDIVRKKLKRRESNQYDNPPVDQAEEIKSRESTTSTYPNTLTQPEQALKRKAIKLRNEQANCDKIKNRIVNQLFMMDKDKILELMDNPNSSSKFEYAISSLVTESQRSYNHHLRSVAEKSLSSSSSDFIHHDNNTIYEDTFMKQMQCILDPQDTVLLEDIKPIVLAELCKVLQVDDLDQLQSQNYDEQFHPPMGEQSHYGQFPPNSIDFEEYHSNDPCDRKPFREYSPRSGIPYTGMPKDHTEEVNETKHLFERRKAPEHSDRRTSSSNMYKRRKELRGTETKSRDERYTSGTPRPSDYGSSGIPTQDENTSDRKCKSPARQHDSDYTNDTSKPKEYKKSGSTPSVNNMSSKKCKTSHLRNDTSQPNECRKTGSPTPVDSSYGKCKIDSDVSNATSVQQDVGSDCSAISPNQQRRSSTPVPLFDANNPNFLDVEETFAELDKQYHVAVDHTLIEKGDFVPQQQHPNKTTTSQVIKNEITSVNTPEESKESGVQPPDFTSSKVRNAFQIKKEIEIQLQDFAKSSFKKPPITENKTSKPTTTTTILTQTDNTVQKSVSVQEISKTPADKPQHASSPSTNSLTSRKRSIDEKPSHRKEKRKKSDSESHSESNKPILNKNIIINVNDCKEKSLENCDAPKSVVKVICSNDKGSNNTSKETNKFDISDKNQPEKHTKRKDDKRKSRDKEIDTKKRRDSSTPSHSTTLSSPTEPNNSQAQTPTKSDSKLKPIDMFVEQPKKSSNNNNKTPVELIKQPLGTISRKITKRHVATQAVGKTVHQETQTVQISSSRFSQTDKKKFMTRGMQTEPVSFKSTTNRTDPLERMKEIDMEIQSLLQEKFKLYSSIENKDQCENNTMQSLGMAVLNVAPFDEGENGMTTDAVEDSIVDDFANIPVEELEKIALETVHEVQQQNAEESRVNKQKQLSQERHTSPSLDISMKSTRHKKSKTPNISLIEQIITDDRPLEDIISLDDLELSLPKAPKKKGKQTKPKKKPSKKTKKEKSMNVEDYVFRECSVVLKREDLESKLRRIIDRNKRRQVSTTSKDDVSVVSQGAEVTMKEDITTSKIIEQVVEEVVNDIQFDMLDVSEDIVIGESCEVKCTEKDSNGMSNSSINEGIILDNSQSSLEDAATSETGTNSRECKIFDFSSDESLRRDSVIVTGNGDAVLAIECIDDNFIAACLDGNVYYFNAKGQLLNTLRGSNLAVTCLTIVKEKYGTTVYTGSLDSRIRYYDLETGLEKGPECNVLSPIQTMDRAWDTIFVGTRTGFVLQFECKNDMLIPVSTIKFSEQSILALRAMKEGPRKVLLVAARSENVTIKDAQTGLLLRTLEGPKMTVYTLLFEDGKVYCGTSSHHIHVFDYASGGHVGTHMGGKGAVCLRSVGGLLFAGCYDGCVYVYRDGDARPLAQLRGPAVMLLSLAIHGSKIIAGYKDRSLFIWKIPLNVLQEMIL